MPDQLTSRPLLDFTFAEAADALSRSFEQYFVPMATDAAGFERRYRTETYDAAASRIWFRGGELLGIVFIARRGWTSRVAGMGLVVEARGQGYGRLMLQTALDEATARGDRTMLLEVFDENEPARRLYERLGFRHCRHLVSYQRQPAPAPVGASSVLTETDPLTVAHLLTQAGETDLPWMFAPESLAATAPPARAFQLDNQAYAVVRPDPTRTTLMALFVRPEARRQGRGRRLVQALEAAFPDKPLMMPLMPEGAGRAFLQAMGWEKLPLTLSEMTRPL